MANLTRREIVKRVSENTHLQQDVVFAVLQATLEGITDALAFGRNVELRNFGVFEVVWRESKVGRNPKKPTEVVTIPAHARAKFKSGKVMTQRVRLWTDELKKGKSA